MGANTKIEWADHTFNPWIGCTKVSPGCKNCYAERDMDHRFGRVHWGPQGQRVRTGEANWRRPLAWNGQVWGECTRCGWRGYLVGVHKKQLPFCGNCGSTTGVVPARARVFCASLADVFENRPELHPWREELFGLICDTPNLDWLLLTKRPENVCQMVDEILGPARLGWEDLPNVWIGASVEDQTTADERIPHLLEVPAAVRFLSCEPLLGPISLAQAHQEVIPAYLNFQINSLPIVDWVIAGGESGPKARPTRPQWVRDLRDQCVGAGVPFNFKQWGEWVEVRPGYDGVDGISRPEWGFFEDGEFAKGTGTPSPSKRSAMVRVGRKAAGRHLDGREWNEFPKRDGNE